MSDTVKKEQALSVAVNELRPMLQLFNENLSRYINDNERYKLGRVLTIIDASFTDPDQRKAVKDLVQNEWWNTSSRASDTPMVNPHTDIRAMTEALGFELYHPIELPVTVPEKDWHMSNAVERYKRAANDTN